MGQILRAAFNLVEMPAAATCFCSAVEYQGKMWLVPKWLPQSEEGYARPERMISLERIRYVLVDQKTIGLDLAGFDIVVGTPLPKALLDGDLKQFEGQFVVLEKPDAKFETAGQKPFFFPG